MPPSNNFVGTTRQRLSASSYLISLLLLLHVVSYSPATADNSEVTTTSYNNTIMVPQAASRIRNEPESVWQEFIQLALDHKPLNLGQGFPDFAAPQYLLESLHNATRLHGDAQSDLNSQYTRSFGHPRLVKAIASYYNKFRNFSQLVEPNKQVLVTVGAYEALFVTIMAFVEPDDEVLIIDPAFDAYAPLVSLAQGKQVYVPLRRLNGPSDNSTGSTMSSAEFGFDMVEFESKISNKTKLLILNTPNNPLGKVYSRQELEQISLLCKKHNLLVLADEVYEHMCYDRWAHLSIASLPGMWERTITVGSAGKAFSVTGWKIGWAFGPAELVKYLQLVHQTAVYTVATPLQESLARALEHEMSLLPMLESDGDHKSASSLVESGELGKTSYWPSLRLALKEKRDRMVSLLESAKLMPIVPQAGYFMLVDFSRLASEQQEYSEEQQFRGSTGGGGGLLSATSDTNDFRFARWLSVRKGLQGIPASAFYSPDNKPLAANLIRFCFIKRDATLDKLKALIETRLSSQQAASRPAQRSKL